MNHCFLIPFSYLFFYIPLSYNSFNCFFSRLINLCLLNCYLHENDSIPFNICFSHNSKILFLSINHLFLSHYSMEKVNIVFPHVHYYTCIYYIFSSPFVFQSFSFMSFFCSCLQFCFLFIVLHYLLCIVNLVSLVFTILSRSFINMLNSICNCGSPLVVPLCSENCFLTAVFCLLYFG